MSSSNLKECFQMGANSIGWARRDPVSAAMQKGEWLLGIGLDGGIYQQTSSNNSTCAALFSGGHMLVHGTEGNAAETDTWSPKSLRMRLNCNLPIFSWYLAETRQCLLRPSMDTMKLQRESPSMN